MTGAPDPTADVADVTVATHSATETQRFAAALAASARPGDVYVLAGDLGAGKTTFTQGFGRELGVTEQITSPTFTLAREYHGRLTVHHLDVYRLDQLDEVMDLALPELLESGGVVLIEWGNTILPALPPDFLDVRIGFGDDDDDRLIEMRLVGPRWATRRRAVEIAAAQAGQISGPGDGTER